MGKVQDDLRDINVIVDEIIKFGKMTFNEYKTHIDRHSEDKMHWLDMPTGGHRPISREAALRFSGLAKRQRDIDPDPDTLDLGALDQAIRAEFVETFIINRRPIERKFIDRMLNSAVRRAKQTHESITYYLPCVVMTKGDPPEFKIGPVRFISTDKFFADFWEKVNSDYDSAIKRQRQTVEQLKAEGKYRPLKEITEEESGRLDGMFIDRVYEYYKSYVWVAEVTVPVCDPKISRERAETAVQAALDILKLFLGHYGGRDFRLGHDRARPDKTADLTRDPDGMFHHSIGQHGEGAFAESGWYESIQKKAGWALQAAGNAIEGYLKPEIKSDHRDRWLDALNWYSQAVAERLQSAQLVKYVAALERLTVTPSDKIVDDVTDIVTRRTALLAVLVNEDAALTEARENTRKLYRWRSNLMHGRSSPLTKELGSVMHLAHEMVPQAIFGALALFADLEMSGRFTSDELFARYSELEKKLAIELRTKLPKASIAISIRSALQLIEQARTMIRSASAREKLAEALSLLNAAQ
jgi:hypothetical protein